MLTRPALRSAVPLFGTFLALSSKFRKGYCIPSQAKLLKLMGEWYGHKISRATLNNHVRELEREGYFRRRRRLRNLGPKGMRFDTTMYELFDKGRRYFLHYGAPVAAVIALLPVPNFIWPAGGPGGGSSEIRCESRGPAIIFDRAVDKTPTIDPSGFSCLSSDLLPRIRDFIKSIS